MQDLLTFSIVAIPAAYATLMTANFITGLLRLWQKPAPKVVENNVESEPVSEEAIATVTDPWDEPVVKLPQMLISPLTPPRLLLLPQTKELPAVATPKRLTPSTTKRKAPPRKTSKKKSA